MRKLRLPEVKILTKDTYLVNGRIVNCRALNVKFPVLCLSHLTVLVVLQYT